MKMRRAIIISLSVVLSVVNSVYAVDYQIIDLGTNGGSNSRATSINNNNQIVGWFATSASSHAFLYENGNMIDLGTLGGIGSEARSINDSGQVVGQASTANDGSGSEDGHAFLYEDTMMDLGTIGGRYSDATDINNNGQIVGWSSDISNEEHAFLYENGTMEDMFLGSAKAINDLGQIVGIYQGHAYLYDNGLLNDIGSLGGFDTNPHDINNDGLIVGSSQTSELNFHAFLYDKGVIKDLGTLGGKWSTAYGINELGQIVGNSETSDGYAHAFIYENGLMTDIGSLDGNFSVAYSINNNGLIVGYSDISTGAGHAVLWSPTVVPAPTNSDLIVTSFRNPRVTKKPNKKFMVKDIVMNQGVAGAGQFTIGYYLSKDYIKSEDDIYLAGNRNILSLGIGKSSDEGGIKSVKVKIPSDTSSGRYYVIACADNIDEVVESDETNNCQVSNNRIKVLK